MLVLSGRPESLGGLSDFYCRIFSETLSDDVDVSITKSLSSLIFVLSIDRYVLREMRYSMYVLIAPMHRAHGAVLWYTH